MSVLLGIAGAMFLANVAVFYAAEDLTNRRARRKNTHAQH